MCSRALMSVFLALACLAGFPSCKGGSPSDPEPPATDVSFGGTIMSGGTPLAGVQVFLSWDDHKSVLTDTNGRFSFSGLSGDNFVVTPSLRNSAFVPSNYELGRTSRNDLNFVAVAPTYGSKVGTVAADFTAVDNKGQPVSLYSYFGQVVYMDWAADWCGPCAEQAVTAEGLFQTFKSQGLQMLTLLISGSTSVWATTYGLTFPVLDDHEETIGAIFDDYFLPLNIVLDRNMTIRYRFAGTDENGIKAAIRKYL